MDGLEELFESILGADDLPIESFATDGGLNINVEDILSGDFGNIETSSLGDIDSGFETAMDYALDDFNEESLDFSSSDSIPFTGQSHHEPFDGEPSMDNGNQISFEGSGDKYNDNEYNKEQADKWLKKEQDCLAKGDTTGAAAAHSTAKKHLGRIKK